MPTARFTTRAGVRDAVRALHDEIPALALAGSLAAKKAVPPSAGTFPTNGAIFVVLLVGVILIVAALTFFPADAWAPSSNIWRCMQGKLF